MSYEEEDTCMSYEEEDTCMSYEEEDTYLYMHTWACRISATFITTLNPVTFPCDVRNTAWKMSHHHT